LTILNLNKELIVMNKEISCVYQSLHAELRVEHLYSTEMNDTFAVYVKSYQFTGSYNFCLHIDKIQSAIQTLRTQYDNLEGACKIADDDSDAFICLEFCEGELKISGQLGGSYEENCLKFSFSSDQTVIKLLQKILTQAIM